MIQREQPDVVCLNELNGEWWYYVEQLLCGEDGVYGYSGRTAAGAEVSEFTGEKWDTTPLLLYNKGRYKLVEEGSFLCPADERGICTINNWAVLRDKATGAEFVAMAQHLAAGSTAVRIKVREDSARLIVDKIKEIAGELPVIIMGDYNCGEGSSPYEIFVDSGFHDSSHMNPTAAFRGTYSGWSLKADGTPAKDLDKSVPIDLIILSEDTGYGYSDHYPVLVELNMRKVEGEPEILFPIIIIAAVAAVIAAAGLILAKMRKRPGRSVSWQ